MADADRDAVYKFLTTKNNLDFLRTFCSRENIHNISLVINEDDNPNQGEEYLLESDPSLKSFPSTNIIFIKKIPYLDCSDIKKIKKDLQILNFSTESNDTTMLSHIQNCIQSTFLSLFNSYKELIKIEKTSAIKTYNVNQLQNKVTELVDSINKTWKTSNIPVVKLEFEKFYLAIKEKLKKEKGREPTADDFLSVLDDTQLNSLYDCLNKWQAEISQVIKMDRNLSDGNTLDEIEFWVDYIKVIKSIKKQLESSDVQITLDIAIKKGKTFITNPFLLNTKTDEYIKRADSYNILLKDLPIKEMYNSNNIDDLIIQIQKIFEVVKNKMRLSDYPLKRVQQLIDCVNEDMISQLIKIIGPNLMSMKYDDFHELMKKCSNLFEKIWKSEFEQLKKDIQELAKKKNEDLLQAKASFPHNSLQGRLSDINSFRLENKELVEITLKLNKSNTNSEKKEESQITRELKNAYKLSYNIDVLDLSDNGVNAWANVKSEYNKVVEKIEGQISSSLSEQLASAQNIIEKFRIFEKFKIIIKRPRIQASIQDYQRALIRNVSEDLNILKEKFNSGYENSSAAKLCSIRGIPPISGEIIWNNQFLAQAESYKNKIASVLGDTWESTEEGKKIKNINSII
jgi:dynein heavy chain 1